jgi:hypothetical protein
MQTTAAPLPTKSQPFNNPVVPAKPTFVAATPNLIQSTNATERAVLVARGRTDPFANIVAPPPVFSTTTIVSRPVPALPSLPTVTTVGIRPRQRSAVISVSTTRRNTTVASARLPLPRKVNIRRSYTPTPVFPKVLPQVVTNPTLVPVLPPPLQPELARAVLITGVIQVGDEPQAIIKAPNEPTSRYVQVGDRLANGVLIKRIEMNEGSAPVVILEQYGIEVARMVGDIPTPSTTASTPPENPASTEAS